MEFFWFKQFKPFKPLKPFERSVAVEPSKAIEQIERFFTRAKNHDSVTPTLQ